MTLAVVIYVVLAAIADALLYFWVGPDPVALLSVPAFIAVIYFGILYSTIFTSEVDENEAIMNQYRGAPKERR